MRSCNNKLIDVLRYLEQLRGVLATCGKGQVWIIRGEECVNLRVEGINSICKTLNRCSDLIQEVMTENEES